jgi:sugar lactone lactonase YvrE
MRPNSRSLDRPSPSQENFPTGRLIEYDPKTKVSRTLVDDVAFANGLLVDADETYILFVELNRAQILRYDLKAGEKNKLPIHWDARRSVE